MTGCFGHFHQGEVLLGDGCLDVGRDRPGQALPRPRKPRPGALPGRVPQWERDRHGHSSDRVTVEHALADHERWEQLIRWMHRRDRLPDTYRAIAALVSDRSVSTWSAFGGSAVRARPMVFTDNFLFTPRQATLLGANRL
ncbi:hypothetical protein GCM10010145_46910 [Streptomyces ruber]|uniref:Uncharacterized protein n=2 Tax=Streptomyces TaxID=1883 RepID=A0A918BIP6_9ACTN|nr:hypothetical protein GCM10010145_46910 [Streptomyces ruber]